MAQSLDDLRSAHPDLGFALYAIEPRGAVTLEVYDDGRVYSFKGATAEAAIETAFPSEPPTPETNVFD